MVRRTELLFYQGSDSNTVVSRFSSKILKKTLTLAVFSLVGQKKVLHATKNSTLENCSAVVVPISFPYRLPINPFSEVY